MTETDIAEIVRENEHLKAEILALRVEVDERRHLADKYHSAALGAVLLKDEANAISQSIIGALQSILPFARNSDAADLSMVTLDDPSYSMTGCLYVSQYQEFCVGIDERSVLSIGQVVSKQRRSTGERFQRVLKIRHF